MIYLIKNAVINLYSIPADNDRETMEIAANNSTEKIHFTTRSHLDTLFLEYIKSFYSICKMSVMVENDLNSNDYHKNPKKVSCFFADNYLSGYYGQQNSSFRISFYSSTSNESRHINITCLMNQEIHNELIVPRANGINNAYQIIVELESDYYSKEKPKPTDPENQNRVQALEI